MSPESPEINAQSELPLSFLPEGRLARQLRFLLEIDRLKTILRRSRLTDGSRLENSAEHSWHLGMLAMTLSEYAIEPVDAAHVVRMVLVHDLVEIDAGDTFVYDTTGMESKAEREKAAAERIFSLLPDDLNATFRDLWEEFERQESPEARFAAALDRLMPMMHNYIGHGGSWQEHGITADRVRNRNFPTLAAGAPALHEAMIAMIDDAVRRGYLPEG